MKHFYIGKEKGAREFKVTREKKLGVVVRLFQHKESGTWVAISSEMQEIQEEE